MIAREVSVPKATALMYRDVYGWFERPEKGLYQLSPKGRAALKQFAEVLKRL